MGSTRPRSVISPVIARSRRTGTLIRAHASAVAIVTPAEGPSLRIALGEVNVHVVLLVKVRSRPSGAARERT